MGLDSGKAGFPGVFLKSRKNHGDLSTADEAPFRNLIAAYDSSLSESFYPSHAGAFFTQNATNYPPRLD